jgi:hypothetical protein
MVPEVGEKVKDAYQDFSQVRLSMSSFLGINLEQEKKSEEK